MTVAQLLHTIALVAAWARKDEEAVLLLIEGGGPDEYANLIEFVLMVLSQNTEGSPTAYLKFLSEQALALQAREANQ